MITEAAPRRSHRYYQELEDLVVETFSMWEVTRVGFSWRKYYLDHTRQVQNLALRMARELEADVEQLEVAAILHDVTKRYDGAILKDAEGKNVLDEEGFWLNETVRPARGNRVTDLYDRLDLRGQIHHVSGAALTDRILREWGLEDDFVLPVAKIVRGHLKGNLPPEVQDERYREVEVRILYDADTIDPNVGLTAFYRNIQITAGNAMKRGEAVDLAAYVRNLPRWVNMKDAFREQMLTDLGRQLCDERQGRSRELLRLLEAELEDGELNRRYGLLGAVDFLFTGPEDPSLHEHAAALRERWLPAREALLAAEAGSARERGEEALARSRRFAGMLHAEIAGEL